MTQFDLAPNFLKTQFYQKRNLSTSKNEFFALIGNLIMYAILLENYTHIHANIMKEYDGYTFFFF